MAPRIKNLNPAGALVQGHALCEDIGQAKPKDGLLALSMKVSKNWQLLPQVPGLKRLFAYGVKAEQLAIIGELSELELLCLSTPKGQ